MALSKVILVQFEILGQRRGMSCRTVIAFLSRPPGQLPRLTQPAQTTGLTWNPSTNVFQLNSLPATELFQVWS